MQRLEEIDNKNKTINEKISQHSRNYIKQNHIYWNRNKSKYKNGWYRGIWCDSSWQLAFVIYNLEHDIKFERNKEGFEYQHQGHKHTYFPDFIMEDGTYVQIKGVMSEKAKIKIETFKYPLIVIDPEGIKPYIKYAIQKYGKNFISLYQNVTYEDRNYITCPQCGKKMLKQSKLCKYCAPKLKRKIQRPTKEVLEEQLKTNTYTSLGKKYGVTDNAIRRWCREYGILISKEQMKERKRQNLLKNTKKRIQKIKLSKELLEEELKIHTYKEISQKYHFYKETIRYWCREYGISLTKQQVIQRRKQRHYKNNK